MTTILRAQCRPTVLLREQCKAILREMRKVYDDVVSDHVVDNWDYEECEYVVVNYGSWIDIGD